MEGLVELILRGSRTVIEYVLRRWKRPDDFSDLVNYECPCCYNEVPFDYLVQCEDGHLFCVECFQRYVKEAVYGQGQQTLRCFSENCGRTFSESQILRALPDSLREKFEERIQDEILSMSNLENVVKCPFCNTGAILDLEHKFFECPKCWKVSCRLCRLPYEGHEGRNCTEAEVDKHTQIRKQYEEKMAAVLIRKCPKCNLSFTKKNGCNKIVCRCGAYMCYVCRRIIRGYDHFCQHLRIPGRTCSKCNACSLYTNTDEDDLRNIMEIQKAARKYQNETKSSENWPRQVWRRFATFFSSFSGISRAEPEGPQSIGKSFGRPREDTT